MSTSLLRTFNPSLALHDALPIFPTSPTLSTRHVSFQPPTQPPLRCLLAPPPRPAPSFVPFLRRPANHYIRVASTQRSEEHTSELQSHSDLVCRLLHEKKKQIFDR